MADYTIQGGDNLSRIAKAHGTDVNTLLKLNPELKKHPNSIMKGDTLKLPDAPKGAEDIDMKDTMAEQIMKKMSEFKIDKEDLSEVIDFIKLSKTCRYMKVRLF